MSLAKPPHRRAFIREWRKRAGLNQNQLAERIIMPSGNPITQGHLSKLENGKLPYTQPLLEQIADALNCTVADLIVRDPSQTDMIWSIWNQLRPPERDQAIRVLQALAGQKAA